MVAIQRPEKSSQTRQSSRRTERRKYCFNFLPIEFLMSIMMIVTVVVVIITQIRTSRQQKQQLLFMRHDSTYQEKNRDVDVQNSSSFGFSIVDTSQWARPSINYQIDPNDLWEDENHHSNQMVRLPQWLKQYFRWHKEKIIAHRKRVFNNKNTGNNIAKIDLNDDDDFRVLYVTCLATYRKCGGTADRLLSIPFFLKIAAQSHRVLLIQWTKPAPLEAFLVPPEHGMDWRVITVDDNPILRGYKVGTEETILEAVNASNITILQVKFQSNDHGRIYYDSLRESEHEPDYQTIFHVMWKVLFTPSPPLAAVIKETLSRSKLMPGKYVSAHVRALYNTKQRDPDLVKTWSIHAVHCALFTLFSNHQHLQQTPSPIIYFASDSEYAVQVALQYGRKAGISIRSRAPTETGTNPLHLDKTKDWKQRPASDFYDVFVDLYLLGLGSCVTYGMGGYGYFASLISNNPHCSLVHMTATSQTECPLGIINNNKTITRWIYNQQIATFPTHEMSEQLDKMFLPPILLHDKNPAINEGRKMMLLRDTALMENRRQGLINKQAYVTTNKTLDDPNMQGRIPDTNERKLPRWMKLYFEWHHKQRQILNRHNWKKFRYIVMACLESDTKCGGTADRLRPVPSVLRVAAETKRLLLIKWEKPAALEHFLLPPQSSIALDWRTPDYIRFEDDNGPKINSVSLLVQQAQGNGTVVKAQIQSHDHGSQYYNRKASMNTEEDEGIYAFREHYHDCWHSLFTPSPILARRIQLVMDGLNLVPGEFAFAHLRANYGIEDVGRDTEYLKQWTQNALNCVSGLRPGGPYFFASDSLYAKKIAIQYGAERNVSVVSVIDDKAPLHLDLVKDWKTRSPSDYYPIFVDLYIMSMGTCFSYNVGGFAKWAQLISGHEFSCNQRHWTKGVGKRTANKEGCAWTDVSNSLPINFKMNGLTKLPLFAPPISG